MYSAVQMIQITTIKGFSFENPEFMKEDQTSLIWCKMYLGFLPVTCRTERGVIFL